MSAVIGGEKGGGKRSRLLERKALGDGINIRRWRDDVRGITAESHEPEYLSSSVVITLRVMRVAGFITRSVMTTLDRPRELEAGRDGPADELLGGAVDAESHAAIGVVHAHRHRLDHHLALTRRGIGMLFELELVVPAGAWITILRMPYCRHYCAAEREPSGEPPMGWPSGMGRPAVMKPSLSRASRTLRKCWKLSGYTHTVTVYALGLY